MTGRASVIALLACHDRRELTLAALRSWFGQDAPGLRLGAVLVDDGSTDGTAEAVRQRFPEVKVIPADGSLFWAASMARAEQYARMSRPDALVWLNDDVTLWPECLATLHRTAAQYRPTAVVAGALADPATGRAMYGGMALSRWHPMRGRLLQPAGRPVRIDAAHGNVLYVPRATYEQLSIDGGFQHAYADYDYSLRVRRLGLPLVLTAAPVGSCAVATTSRGLPDLNLTLRRRLQLLNSPLGTPLRSHARYLRRHAGPWWPALAVAPYVKEVLRGRRMLRSRRRVRR